MQHENLPRILQYIKDAEVFNLSKLDHHLAFPKGTLSKAVSGGKSLSDNQISKLTWLFNALGINYQAPAPQH
jgi:hypothetical protein